MLSWTHIPVIPTMAWSFAPRLNSLGCRNKSGAMQGAHLARRISSCAVHGFTLLELLVVIVIIGLLAGLVAPRYFETVDKSKVKVVRAQMDTLSKVLEQYRLEVGHYPTQEQGLQALMVQPPGVRKWQGPYLKKDIPVDPWGNPYLYQLSASGREFDLISLGSDGQPGGDGDAKDIALSDKATD